MKRILVISTSLRAHSNSDLLAEHFVKGAESAGHKVEKIELYSVPERAEAGLTGWIDCYPKARLAGTLFCGGVNEPNEIEGNAKLQEAFLLGKSV